MKITGILLAAGAGSRFGGDKLIHPLADGTPIGVASARNLRAVLPEVIAVVRPGDLSLAHLLEDEGCRSVVCEQAAEGMGFSLACGVAASREAQGWVVALADMPHISSNTLQRVVGELGNGAAIVTPVYRGQRGHPVGFSAQFLDELTRLSGDSGARSILQQHKDEITLIECDDDAKVLYDIDRKSDIQS